jgi:heme-degrading monooxygenase HmoA
LLKERIFVGIRNRHIPGFKSIQLLRRAVGDEVEFVTIMVFDSLDAVRESAGEDHEVAVVPEKARAMLSHFDERSRHYDIGAKRTGAADTDRPGDRSLGRPDPSVLRPVRSALRSAAK